MRLSTVLCCLAGAAGFHAPLSGVRALGPAASPAAGSVAMRHKDFVLRVTRAEEGRPRLCVFRSNNHIYAQVIDDSKGTVVASASTIEKDQPKEYGGNVASAQKVGQRVAERAKEKGVEKVWFDRNGRKYHGRVAALADAAREAG